MDISILIIEDRDSDMQDAIAIMRAAAYNLGLIDPDDPAPPSLGAQQVIGTIQIVSAIMEEDAQAKIKALKDVEEYPLLIFDVNLPSRHGAANMSETIDLFWFAEPGSWYWRVPVIVFTAFDWSKQTPTRPLVTHFNKFPRDQEPQWWVEMLDTIRAFLRPLIQSKAAIDSEQTGKGALG